MGQESVILLYIARSQASQPLLFTRKNKSQAFQWNFGIQR